MQPEKTDILVKMKYFSLQIVYTSLSFYASNKPCSEAFLMPERNSQQCAKATACSSISHYKIPKPEKLKIRLMRKNEKENFIEKV